MKTKIETIVFLLLTLFCSYAIAEPKQAISDQTITQDVLSKIASNKVVSNLDVIVLTNRGVVKLTGNVDTDTQASTLIELASSVQGVKKVDNTQLVVKESKHPINDTVITAKVKGSFMREKVFGDADVSAMSIVVETKNGIVYLTGTADNQIQIDNAIRLAKSIDGVKGVDSKITVK